MKRLILVSALLCGFVCANSQTMYFWKNNVALAAEASALGVMQYTQNGTALTVVDSVMDLQNIDSITVGTPVDESTVRVDYSSNGATAVVPFSLSRKVAVSISGAYVNAVSTALDGNDIVYSLSGKSSDGAFLQTGTYKCTVQLNGLELTSLQGAAINIANGKRIKMILADGTENTLSDMAGGTQKACLYVKGHPEFEGNGTLNVTGNTSHAIASGEYMYVKSGNINVLASANDGIHAGQYFKIKSGSVVIRNAKGDGIQADITKNAIDEFNGQMIINGGKIDISSNSSDVKLLRCDSLMTISGGTIVINGNGDGIKGIATDGNLVINKDNGDTNISVTVSGGVYTDPATSETSKTRCIKVNGDFTITAGTLKANATGKKSATIKVDGVSAKSAAASVTTNDGYVFDQTL